MIPDIGVANGVMSVILNYAKAMPENIAFDVVYFHETEETRRNEIESLGGRVYKIHKPSLKDLINNKQIKLLFENNKSRWQALHIHAPHFAAFIAPAAKKAGINRICVHCHTTEFSLKGNPYRNKLLSLYAKYFVKDKFACSKTAGELWYGAKPFTVLNNAIDCEKYRFNEQKRNEIRQSLDLTDKFVLCHIGRTDIPQKNHPFLFKVFAEVTMQKNNAVLMLIGAEETESLSTLAKQLDVEDSIMYLGFRSDVSDLLQAGDVFVFPSLSEGLPVSVIEAQAASLPVVISDSVTDEVNINNVISLSLNSSVQVWAGKIVDFKSKKREPVSVPEWDIINCSKKLKDYYE